MTHPRAHPSWPIWFAFCAASLALLLLGAAPGADGQHHLLHYSNALALAFLLAYPGQGRPVALWLLGASVLHLWLSAPLPSGVIAERLLHLLEIPAGLALLRRWLGPGDFRSDPAALARLLLLGCALPPLIGAALAALATMAAAPADAAAAANAWSAHYLDGAVGAAAMLPLSLGLFSPPPPRPRPPDLVWHRASLTALMPLTCWLALAYLNAPFVVMQMPLTLIAIRLSFTWTAALVFGCVLLVDALLSSGYGLPAEVFARWHGQALQLPLLTLLLPPLLLAASVGKSRRMEALRTHDEQTLAANNVRLQTILDHMPAMIGYWDRDLHNVFGNRAYVDYFGLDPEQIRGKHIREVIGEQRYRLNQPYMEQALAGQTPMFERLITDTAGVARHTLASYVPDVEQGVVRGFYAFVTDITPLKQAQQQSTAARQQLQAIIDAASEFAIIAAGPDGRITQFNRGAERLLGYCAARMLGRSARRLLLRRELEARAAALSAQLGRPIHNLEALAALPRSGVPDEHCWHLRRRDGSLVPVRLVVTPMGDAGTADQGFLGIASDITRQHQLEQTLVQAKELAEAANRAKSEFVANMSHEIRTPLNGVLGMTYLLETSALSADQRSHLAMIRQAGHSLLKVLNDILDFEKLGAGRMTVQPQPFSLDELLADVCNGMAVLAGDKPLELLLTLEADVPATLVGDAGRLQQVLMNLLGNAIKFTERGQVGLRLAGGGPETAPAAGSEARGAAPLRCIIHDSGIGIDAAQRARLFQPFSQADSSISRRYGGSGLGLSIARQLVELMGGTITLDSTPGVGSTFTVSLPLTAAGATTPAAAGAGLRLLVIDQDGPSRAALCQTLATRAMLTHCVVGVAAALQQAHRAQATGQPYHALLIHQRQLAQGQDWRALAALRAAAAAPVLAMVDGPAGRHWLAQHCPDQLDAVLAKPISPAQLLAALQPAVRSAPTASARPLLGTRVLLVEDVPLNQMVACGMLQQAGAQVDVAADGRQALQRLRQAEYQLVLMDIHMPDMDGYQATRALRSELGLRVPVLAVTAGVTASERQRCLDAGADGVIAKPLQIEALLACILPHLATPAPAAAPGDASRLDELLALSGGDRVYQQQLFVLAGNALHEQPQQLLAARQDWQGACPEAAAERLHAMRGTLGMLGARHFVTLAQALEQDLLAPDGHVDATAFDTLDAALQAALAAIRAWLAQHVALPVNAAG